MSNLIKYRVIGPQYAITTIDKEEVIEKIKRNTASGLPSSEEEKVRGWLASEGETVGTRCLVDTGKVSFIVEVQAVRKYSENRP